MKASVRPKIATGSLSISNAKGITREAIETTPKLARISDILCHWFLVSLIFRIQNLSLRFNIIHNLGDKISNKGDKTSCS